MNPDLVYVSFSADINPSTTETLLKVCCDLSNKGVKTLYLLMSTPGGRVMNGINLYAVLRALPSKIITHNVGAVDSIGNAVFLAGDERYANPEATFMFHGVGLEVNAKTKLEEKNLLEQLGALRADKKKITDIIRDRASFTNEAEIDELFLQAATRDAEFAKDCGIIHDIREAQIPAGAPVVQLVFKR